jgi:hypothetical protein
LKQAVLSIPLSLSIVLSFSAVSTLS